METFRTSIAGRDYVIRHERHDDVDITRVFEARRGPNECAQILGHKNMLEDWERYLAPCVCELAHRAKMVRANG